MKPTKLQKESDVAFLRACAVTNSLDIKSPTRAAATLSEGQMLVRIAISNTEPNMRASFDPVSSEKASRTKALNQISRLGYRSPKVSTR